MKAPAVSSAPPSGPQTKGRPLARHRPGASASPPSPSRAERRADGRRSSSGRAAADAGRAQSRWPPPSPPQPEATPPAPTPRPDPTGGPSPPLPPRLAGSLPTSLPGRSEIEPGEARGLSETGGAAGPRAAPSPPPHPAGRGHGPPALGGTPGPAPLPAAPLPAAVRAEGSCTHHAGRVPGGGLRPPSAAAHGGGRSALRLLHPPAPGSPRQLPPPRRHPLRRRCSSGHLERRLPPCAAARPFLRPAGGERGGTGRNSRVTGRALRGEGLPGGGAVRCAAPCLPCFWFVVGFFYFFFFSPFVLSLHFLVPSAHAEAARLRDRGFGSSLRSVRARELCELKAPRAPARHFTSGGARCGPARSPPAPAVQLGFSS